jgi:hypothetical protein
MLRLASTRRTDLGVEIAEVLDEVQILQGGSSKFLGGELDIDGSLDDFIFTLVHVT